MKKLLLLTVSAFLYSVYTINAFADAALPYENASGGALSASAVFLSAAASVIAAIIAVFLIKRKRKQRSRDEYENSDK